MKFKTTLIKIWSKGNLFVIKIKNIKYLCIFLGKSRQNVLSFWRPCKKSTCHNVSMLLTGLPQSPLQNSLGYSCVSIGETAPRTTLWQRYFTIFQFKVNWKLCCSPPEWFSYHETEKTTFIFSAVEHNGQVMHKLQHWLVRKDSPGWTQTSALTISVFRNNFWQALLYYLAQRFSQGNTTWQGRKSRQWAC